MNCKLVCSLIFLIFFSMVPYAESGTILISDDKIYNNYQMSSDHVFAYNTNYSYISFDTSDYNYISSFEMKPVSSGISFRYSFESTTFTIDQGATGSGVAWYDANTSKLYWVFDSSVLIYSSPIHLKYAKDIFHNVTHTPYYADGVVSETQPVCVKTGQYNNTYCDGAEYYYNVNLGTRGTDSYIVNYLPNNLFSINITKNSFLSTKYFILGYSTEYSRETSFSNISITGAVFTYQDGLILNVTLNSGLYKRVVVNSTISILPATPGTLIFDSNSPAYVGSMYGLAWNFTAWKALHDDPTLGNGQYFGHIYGPNSVLVTDLFDVGSGLESTGRVHRFCNLAGSTGAYGSDCTAAGSVSFGIWTAEIHWWAPYDPFGLCEIVNSCSHPVADATINVFPVTSSGINGSGFNVSSDKKAYSPGDTMIVSIVNPSSTDVFLNIQDDRLPKFGILKLSSNVLVPSNSNYQYPIEIPNDMSPGNYTIFLSGSRDFVTVLSHYNFTISFNTVVSNSVRVWQGSSFVYKSTAFIGFNTTILNSSMISVTISSFWGSKSVHDTFTVGANESGKGYSSGSRVIKIDAVGFWTVQIVDLGNSANNWSFSVNVFDSPCLVNCGKTGMAEFVKWDSPNHALGSPFSVQYQVSPMDNSVYLYNLIITDPKGAIFYKGTVLNTSTNPTNPFVSVYKGVFLSTSVQGNYSVRLNRLNVSAGDGINVTVDTDYTTVGNASGSGASPAETPYGYNGTNSGGTGGFASDEVSGDFVGNYKQWVYSNFGTSSGSLFLVGIFHVIIFGVLCLVLSKGMPMMFGVGGLLGLGFSVSINFIPLVWGVIILVLAGMTFMGIMKKG
ncbi:MAG: hypothetical protein O8C61_10150 [Candidatus Methanoperedens sp.]|nr:hypothetical protein [Candidatus Methanoperedens sp.]